MGLGFLFDIWHLSDTMIMNGHETLRDNCNFCLLIRDWWWCWTDVATITVQRDIFHRLLDTSTRWWSRLTSRTDGRSVCYRRTLIGQCWRMIHHRCLQWCWNSSSRRCWCTRTFIRWRIYIGQCSTMLTLCCRFVAFTIRWSWTTTWFRFSLFTNLIGIMFLNIVDKSFDRYLWNGNQVGTDISLVRLLNLFRWNDQCWRTWSCWWNILTTRSWNIFTFWISLSTLWWTCLNDMVNLSWFEMILWFY